MDRYIIIVIGTDGRKLYWRGAGKRFVTQRRRAKNSPPGRSKQL